MNKSPIKKSESHGIINSYWTLAIAVAVGGPFALPLLWRNPRFSKKVKIWGSIAVVVLTVALLGVTGSSINDLMQAYKQLSAIQ